MRNAVIVTCLQDVALYRRKTIVLPIDALDDAHGEWHRIFDKGMGIIAIGGHFAKMRGVHAGSVITEWMTNEVHIVAKYSPYRSIVDGRLRQQHKLMLTAQVLQRVSRRG